MNKNLKTFCLFLCFALTISYMTLFFDFSYGVADEDLLLYEFKSASDTKNIKSAAADPRPGDMNRDGKISIIDSLLLRKFLSGGETSIDKSTADVNADGRITSSDAISLVRHLGGLYGAEICPDTAIISFSEEKNAAKITARYPSPSITVDLEEAVDAESYPYVVFTYITEETENCSVVLTFSNAVSEELELSTDGLRHSVILSYPSDADWSGCISDILISADLSRSESVFIGSILFAKTAKLAAAACAAREEGQTTNEYEQIIFENEDKLSFAEAKNSARVSFDTEEQAAVFTVEGTKGDPQIELNYTNTELYADDYKYIVVTYMVPVSVSSAAETTELFLCSGDLTQAAAGYSKTFSPVKDGAYHCEIISLTDTDYWSGAINLIRFDFFSQCSEGDSMYVDSVCLAKSKASAYQLSRERLTQKGAMSENVIEDTLTVNSETGDIKYYNATGISADGISFSGKMAAIITGVDSSFNRFHIGYSSDSIIRAVAYYTVDGTETEDEFFLENTGGQEQSFTSLITKYFDGKEADGLTMIEFYTITASSSSVKLYSVDKEKYTLYTRGTHFLENDAYKLGIDLLMGGGVNYLEYLNDQNDSYSNLLNNYDVGRLIQQSYYGIDKAPYQMGYWTDRAWGYNPVQGGDKLNNNSRIIDFELRGDDSVYVKVRPMDWGQVNIATPSYMENIYTLTDTYIRVYNRFVDFSGYTHTQGWQELPAFYTISALNNFSYYNGTSPWTGDSLITRSDLVFWGQVSNQAFDLKSTSEFWSAWTDNSGFGVGLYVPGVYTYHAGKFMYDGSCDPAAESTNYVAPRKYLTLVCGKPLEYSYLIAAGSLSKIRNTFKENQNLINNSSLEIYN